MAVTRPTETNLGAWLRLRARETPDRPALYYATGRDPNGRPEFGHRTFRQLDQESDVVARGLQRLGIGRGTVTVLLVKPGRELFVLLFAMFKLGAVAVVVDPGMGLGRMLHCYRSAAAEAFIGISAAHVVRLVRPGAFRSLKTLVTVGRRLGWGGTTLAELEADATDLSPFGPVDQQPFDLATRPPVSSGLSSSFPRSPYPGYGSVGHSGRAPDLPRRSRAISEMLFSDGPFPLAEVEPDDRLIINFTTGSTGPAKGVEYSHATVLAMVQTLPEHFGQDATDTTLVTLPLLGVFDLMLGSTVVMAPTDPTRPARADPALLCDVINRFQTTHMFASPALLHRLANHVDAHGLELPSFRRVISGGAPVSPALVERLRAHLSETAEVNVTYGATEALPIASIESRELAGETTDWNRAGRGTCLGRPVGQIQVRLLPVTDQPVSALSDLPEVAPGDTGEILIRGPLVSPRYHENPRANLRFKVPAPDGAWHRTGDLGWLDARGRLWFCGRQSQRVATAEGPRDTVSWEGIFNSHPDVYRSALVGVGHAVKAPVICVEPREGLTDAARRALPDALAALARERGLSPRPLAVLLHPGFPVDIRHNAKIQREELAAWAESELGIAGEATAPERRGRALWAVPIFGWLLVLYGVVFPFDNPWLRGIWALDVFLSVVVHGVQLAVALPAGRRAGLSAGYTTFMTFLLGATWWRPLSQRGRLS